MCSRCGCWQGYDSHKLEDCIEALGYKVKDLEEKMRKVDGLMAALASLNDRAEEKDGITFV